MTSRNNWSDLEGTLRILGVQADTGRIRVGPSWVSDAQPAMIVHQALRFAWPGGWKKPVGKASQGCEVLHAKPV